MDEMTKLFGDPILVYTSQQAAEWDGKSPGLNPQCKTKAGEEAFFTVERLLVELENEFTEKKNKCDAKKRRALDRKADWQVSQ